MVFNFLEKETLSHERVVFCRDHKTGLKVIIAIHNTTLGPALGGCRMYPYKTEEDALKDVLNLSRAMSYKAACAGLELGGGKAVIIGRPEDKTTEALHYFGECIESFAGKYFVAKDLGTTVEDLKCVAEKTSYAICKSGPSRPSYCTAKGVFEGIKLGVELKLKKDSLKNIKVVIQGIGAVGKELMKLLLGEGAEVFIYDPIDATLKDISKNYPSVHILSLDKVFTTSCDIFAPCALGGAINDETLKTLDCSIIAGAANNQLKNFEMSQKILDKNILYFPDFIINSGGLISVSSCVGEQKSENWIESKIQEIPKSLRSICKTSVSQNISTTEAALKLAIEIIMSKKSTEQSLNL